MILDHERRFIFIHIGKTAGTSLEHALCAALGIDYQRVSHDPWIIKRAHEELPPSTSWLRHPHNGRISHLHITASELRMILGREVWDAYYKFAFVRNPYDHLVSSYSMFTQYDEFASHPWRQYATVEDLLDAAVEGREWLGGSSYRHWLCDRSNRLLVDDVYHFESLAEGVARICERLGIEPIELGNRMSSKHKHYSEYYTPARQAAVYRIRRGDFRRFGYSPRLTPDAPPPPLTDRLRAELMVWQSHRVPRLFRRLRRLSERETA